MSAELNRRFGNPGTAKRPNAEWARRYLRTLELPYPMRAAWRPAVPIHSCQVHYKVLPYMQAALCDVYKHVRGLVKAEVGYNLTTAEYDALTAQKLSDLGLDLFGGTYAHRVIRGGSALSTHAYGIAIDLDPTHNPLGKIGRFAKSQFWVVTCFESRGFEWGGRWRRKDGMHFSWTG